MTEVRLRLFGPARQAARASHDVLGGVTVAEVLAAATSRYGPAFAELLPSCKIWVNGEEVTGPAEVWRLAPGDELAVLPPVSGG